MYRRDKSHVCFKIGCCYGWGKTLVSRADKRKEFRKLTKEGIEFAIEARYRMRNLN